jgi:uncharacterized protein with ATP-grasp and redox domains
MKEKKIKIYEFKELKKEVQEKVLNDFKQYEDFFYLEENLTELLKDVLTANKIKINDLKIRYSLNCCQGDGFSFIGSFEWLDYNVNITLGHLSNLYNHSNTTDIYITDCEGEEIEDEKIINEFSELYQDICRKLEQEGYNIIEDALKDETIIKNIETNEYYFRKSGEIESFEGVEE